MHFHIGRRVEAPTDLELVLAYVKEDRVRVDRHPLRATRIGSHTYLSLQTPREYWQFPDEAAREIAFADWFGEWTLLRYRIEGKRMLLEWLDLDRVHAAIGAGEIGGRFMNMDAGRRLPADHPPALRGGGGIGHG